MTIAIISMIRDSWGGSEELWYEMAKTAVRQGHRVIHLRFEHPVISEKIKELSALGVVCLERPGYINPVQNGSAKAIALTKNYIRKKVTPPLSKLVSFSPDIILYNGTCYSIAAEKELLNYLNIFNGSFFILGHLNHDLIRGISEEERTTIVNAYRRSKRVFFVSQRSIQNAERHLYTEIQNAAVIRNPVNLQSIAPLPFPDITETVNWAMVGNLVTQHKGQDLLLNALSSIKWKDRNWRLNIYGSGTDELYLRRLVQHYSLEQMVFFHGKVGNIRAAWETNHMLLMPSLMEGMPLAVVEAMLCGRPCMITDVGGSAEWVNHGKSGYIAPVASVSALDAVLEDAWAQRNQWALMGNEAHKTASAFFDPNAGATLLKQLIKDHEA